MSERLSLYIAYWLTDGKAGRAMVTVTVTATLHALLLFFDTPRCFITLLFLPSSAQPSLAQLYQPSLPAHASVHDTIRT